MHDCLPNVEIVNTDKNTVLAVSLANLFGLAHAPPGTELSVAKLCHPDGASAIRDAELRKSQGLTEK